eukprot:2564136-Rhodomonas_salina.1
MPCPVLTAISLRNAWYWRGACRYQSAMFFVTMFVVGIGTSRLWAYALAMQCPVLTYAMLLGTTLVEGLVFLFWTEVGTYEKCYAMSGTERAECYAMSGTARVWDSASSLHAISVLTS